MEEFNIIRRYVLENQIDFRKLSVRDTNSIRVRVGDFDFHISYDKYFDAIKVRLINEDFNCCYDLKYINERNYHFSRKSAREMFYFLISNTILAYINNF